MVKHFFKNILGLIVALAAFILFFIVMKPFLLQLGGVIWGLLLLVYMFLVSRLVRKYLWKGRSFNDFTPRDDE